MLEKVTAVYPNTYRGMTDRQRAQIIDEWYRAMQDYPVDICRRAWDKYRNTMKIRELNIAFFIGMIKDLQEADRRDQMRKSIPEMLEPDRNEEWEDARKMCMEKANKAFGRRS